MPNRFIRAIATTALAAAAIWALWLARPAPGEAQRTRETRAGVDLAVVPGTDTIALSWPRPLATVAPIEVFRWTDGEPARRIARVATGSTFVDATAEPNRFYTYRVRAGRYRPGAFESRPAHGIISRLDRAFVCPALPRVPDRLLGVDRSESFATPSGATVAFTIRAPRPAGRTVSVPPCAGQAACSDHANLAAAIAAVVKDGGGTLQLQAGDYHLKPAAGRAPFAHVMIGDATDFVLKGVAGENGVPRTTLIFDAPTTDGTAAGYVNGLAIRAGQRVLVKDLALDWSRDLAIPGRVVDAGPAEQHLVVDNGPYYIPDPANAPDLSLVNAYDLANRVFVFKPWSRLGLAFGGATFNPNFKQDGKYHYVLKGHVMPSGTQVAAIVRSGHGVLVSGNSSDISFEGVHLYAGGASGFVFGPKGRGFRISNSKVVRKPDDLLKPGQKPRLVSIRGDSNARNTEGEMLIESSEFGMIDDDGFNIVGGLMKGAEGTRFDSPTDIAFVFKGYDPFPALWAAGDPLLLVDRQTLKPIGGTVAKVASFTKAFDPATGTYTFHFKLMEPVPLAADFAGKAFDEFPFVSAPRFSSRRFVVRDTCFHDMSGGRLVVQTGDGLIENNVFANTGGPGIEMSSNPVAWSEGPGASNITVRGNRMVGAGYWFDDWNAGGQVTGRVSGWLVGNAISAYALSANGFYSRGTPLSDLAITGNFISNTRGIGILVASAGNVVITDNVVVNANAIPFVAGFDATYCGPKSQGFQRVGANQPWCLAKTAARGAIMVTHAERVRLSGNRTLGTSEAVFVDRKTTD